MLKQLSIRLSPFLLLMRFHKPAPFFLLLWPTLWGLWIAAKAAPPLSVLVIFVAGVVIMRSAGCVINDIIDRDVDRYVTRTQNRPLASGQLSVGAAWLLLCMLLMMAGTLVCLLNTLTIQLAIIALALVVIYPWMKRLTHWPQLVLGLAFSWGILMAFASVGRLSSGLPWWLFASSVLWTMTYDTEYAMADREDDISLGLKSTAVLFGQYCTMITAGFQLLFLLSLLGIGLAMQAAWPYYLGLGVAALFLVYQQKLMQEKHPDAYLRAFNNNNWVGLSLFLGILLSYL